MHVEAISFPYEEGAFLTSVASSLNLNQNVHVSVFDIDEIEGSVAGEDNERKGVFIEIRQKSDPVLVNVELVCVSYQMDYFPVVSD